MCFPLAYITRSQELANQLGQVLNIMILPSIVFLLAAFLCFSGLLYMVELSLVRYLVAKNNAPLYTVRSHFMVIFNEKKGMFMIPKRIAAIHDISGFGRCSLAVIIPILSVMKQQVVSIPTTILSSHTGGLGSPAIRDLPGYVADALTHYEQLGLTFDCIYSGYLGDARHVDDCLAFMQANPAALHVVDPVMGDHGKPYKHVNEERIARMKDLVREADLITPNMTEVCLLLGVPYVSDGMDLLEYKSMLQQLSDMGPDQVVITGARLSNSKIMNVAYDRTTNTCYGIPCFYTDISYPGTGDMFAALLIGGLMDGKDFPDSIEQASRFLELVISQSKELNQDTRYGVVLEPFLNWLMDIHVVPQWRVF